MTTLGPTAGPSPPSPFSPALNLQTATSGTGAFQSTTLGDGSTPFSNLLVSMAANNVVNPGGTFDGGPNTLTAAGTTAKSTLAGRG